MDVNSKEAALWSENMRLKSQNENLRSVLRLTEFGFNHSRCPVCAGWNVGPNGETDRVHTKDCVVAIALKD